MCGTYANNGKSACTIHGIGEKPLIELITSQIRNLARMVEYDEESIIQAVMSARNDNTVSYQGAYENELDAHRKQIDKLDILIENLYTDKVSGLVPDSMFKRQIQKYEQERLERSQAVKVLEKRISNAQPINDSVISWVDLLKQNAEIDTLDTETLLTFIDKIIVSETQQIAGRRVCDIQILYNYIWDAGLLELCNTSDFPFDNEVLYHKGKAVRVND